MSSQIAKTMAAFTLECGGSTPPSIQVPNPIPTSLRPKVLFFCADFVATLARAWANRRNTHVLANVATFGCGFAALVLETHDHRAAV